MIKEIKYYNSKKEYEKEERKRLKSLQKTYKWYKNIEDGMVFWKKYNQLVIKGCSKCGFEFQDSNAEEREHYCLKELKE